MDCLGNISIQVVFVYTVWVYWTTWIIWVDWCIRCLWIIRCYILICLVVDYCITKVSLLLWIINCLTSHRLIKREVTIDCWACYSIKAIAVISYPVTIANACLTILIVCDVCCSCVMNCLSVTIQFVTIFIHVVDCLGNISIQVVFIYTIWIYRANWIVRINWCIWCFWIIWCYILTCWIVDYCITKVSLLLWICNRLTSYCLV